MPSATNVCHPYVSGHWSIQAEYPAIVCPNCHGSGYYVIRSIHPDGHETSEYRNCKRCEDGTLPF
jgi:DnaJ-class molecular chaperone